MSTPILDFTDDGGALLKSVYPTADDVPDFVKTAELIDSSSATDLDDGHFALVASVNDYKLRKFATVDLGNTFISALYLHTYGDQLPENLFKMAAANIEHAFEAYGVVMPEVLKTKVMEKNSSAYTDDSFVPSYTQEVTIGDAVRASEDFDMFYSNLQPEMRRPIAQDIVKMSSTVGISPSERATELAAPKVSPHAANVVRARLDASTDQVVNATYEKLAHILETDEDADPDDAIGLLYMLDKRAGLTGRYGTFIPEPASAIMKGAAVGGMEEQPPGVIYRDAETGKSLTSNRYEEMLSGGELDDFLEEDVVKDLIAAGDGGFDVLPVPLKTAIGRRA